MVATLAAGTSCIRAPSPLTPAWHGSIGTPNSGVLDGGSELPRQAPGLRWLRTDDRHFGIPRLIDAIQRAACFVAGQRPGATLYVGDISTRMGGGPLFPHFSHRSGMDADLLFYTTTLDGAPTPSPGFVHFGAEGLAWDEAHERSVRLDVEREWLLVKSLIEDPDARIEWLFVSDVVAAMLIEWAVARGESATTVDRARAVMLEPHPGGVHDDHVHLRTACSPDEVVSGCVPTGPRRPWLKYELPPAPAEADADLARDLLDPISASD
ncbi:MAG: penicillin-insensitive murein endopeptidase [Polyangiaceae bacterium]